MNRNNWLLAICLSVFVVSLLTAAMYVLYLDSAKPKAKQPTLEQRIEKAVERGVRRGNQPLIDKMNSEDPFPNLKINQRRTFRRYGMINYDKSDRGGHFIDRIDGYLARTRLAGQGRTFYLAAVDREKRLEPRLMPSIAMHESGGGAAMPGGSWSNNFFGITAPAAPGFGSVMATGADGTRAYAAFPTVEVAVDYEADFINRMWGAVSSPYEMHGYATSSAWKPGVAKEMSRI